MEKLTELNRIEKEILNVAEEIFNKDMILKIDILQKEAKKVLGYFDEEISQAIYTLILKKLIFPEKKLTILNVLNNEIRKKILNYININPGTHLREIREKLDLNPRVTHWHLTVLENFELIYRKNYLKYLVFFPSNYTKGFEEPLLVLKNDNAANIFVTIYNYIGLDFEKLKEKIELAPNVILYHLEHLISSGIILPYEEEGKQFFNIDKNRLDIIRKYLNIDLIKEITNKKPEEISISDEISQMIEMVNEEPPTSPIQQQMVMPPKPSPIEEPPKPTLIEPQKIIEIPKEPPFSVPKYIDIDLTKEITEKKPEETSISDKVSKMIKMFKEELSIQPKIVMLPKPSPIEESPKPILIEPQKITEILKEVPSSVPKYLGNGLTKEKIEKIPKEPFVLEEISKKTEMFKEELPIQPKMVIPSKPNPIEESPKLTLIEPQRITEIPKEVRSSVPKYLGNDLTKEKIEKIPEEPFVPEEISKKTEMFKEELPIQPKMVIPPKPNPIEESPKPSLIEPQKKIKIPRKKPSTVPITPKTNPAVKVLIPEIPQIPESEILKTTPTLKSISPQIQEIPNLISIKKEYEYIGSIIRFKIEVQNISNKDINNINVTLIPTTEYEISEKVKIINNLKPAESGGFNFELNPVSSGDSQIFGHISFTDSFGYSHMIPI